MCSVGFSRLVDRFISRGSWLIFSTHSWSCGQSKLPSWGFQGSFCSSSVHPLADFSGARLSTRRTFFFSENTIFTFLSKGSSCFSRVSFRFHVFRVNVLRGRKKGEMKESWRDAASFLKCKYLIKYAALFIYVYLYVSNANLNWTVSHA